MSKFAAGMLMPKATMNENSFLSANKCYVRLPWQIFPVQAVPVSKRMKQAADNQLRLGVLAFDSRHVS
jgi:hypothetical protein